jgi:rRNA pseudouridine-1189 N-methylase Emg1 (Nep1/Mra1 family)
VALVLLVPIAIDGQMRGRRGTSSSAPVHPEAYKDAVVTFHGVLKKLTKKEIIIESDDNHELLTFRRNKATKFLENDTEIKPAAIDMESAVSVDAAEDVDLKLMAIRLTVGASKKDGGELKRK